MNRGPRAIATLWLGTVVLSQGVEKSIPPENDVSYEQTWSSGDISEAMAPVPMRINPVKRVPISISVGAHSVRETLAPRATDEPVLPNVSISVAGGAPTGSLPRISSITIPGTPLPTFDSSSIKAACPQYNHTVIKTPSGQPYDMECGIDYYGGDIQGSNPAITNDYESCLDACDLLPNCVAVSYKPIKENFNFCYLKEKVESGTRNLAIWGGRNVERAHLVLPSATTTTRSTISLATSESSSSSLEVASSSSSDKALSASSFSESTIIVPTMSSMTTATHSTTSSSSSSSLPVASSSSSDKPLSASSFSESAITVPTTSSATITTHSEKPTSSSPSLEMSSSSLRNKAEATSSNAKSAAFPSIESALSSISAGVSSLSSPADSSSTFSTSSISTLSTSSSDPVINSNQFSDTPSSSSSVSHITSTRSSEEPVETSTGVLFSKSAPTRIAINTEAHGPETWSHPVASTQLAQTLHAPSSLLVPYASSSTHVSSMRSPGPVPSASGFKTLRGKLKSSAVPTQSTSTTTPHRSDSVEWDNGWGSVFHTRPSSEASHTTHSVKHETVSVRPTASSEKPMTLELHNNHMRPSVWVPSAPWPAWPPAQDSSSMSTSEAYENPSTTYPHPDCPTTCIQQSTTVPAHIPTSTSTVYTDVTNYVTIHEPTTVTVHHPHPSPTTTTEYITVTQYSTWYKDVPTTVWAHAQTTVTADPSYQWTPGAEGESTAYEDTSTTVQIRRPSTVIRGSESPTPSSTKSQPKHTSSSPTWVDTSFPVPTQEPSGFDSEDQGFTDVQGSSVPVFSSEFPDSVKAPEPTSAPLPWGLIPDTWPAVMPGEFGFPLSGDPFQKLSLPHFHYDKSVQKAQPVRSVPRSESDTYTFHYDVPVTYTDETTQDQESTHYISVPDSPPTSSDDALLEPIAKSEMNPTSSSNTYEFDYDVPILYTATISGEEVPVSTTEIHIPNSPPNVTPAEPAFTDAVDVQNDVQVTPAPQPSPSSDGWYTFSYRTPILYTTTLPCGTCAGGVTEVVKSIDAITIHDPLLGARTTIPSGDARFVSASPSTPTPSSDDGWMDWIPSIPTTGVNVLTPVPIRVVSTASQVDEVTTQSIPPVSAPSVPTSKPLSQPSSSISEPASSAAATSNQSEISDGAMPISPMTPTTSTTTTTVDLSSVYGVVASETTVPVKLITVTEHSTSTRTITSTVALTLSGEHPETTGEPTRSTTESTPKLAPTTDDDASPTVSTTGSAFQPAPTASALFKTFAISGYSEPESTLTASRKSTLTISHTLTVAPSSSAKSHLPKAPKHKSAGTGLKVSMGFVTIVATLVGIVLAVF